MFVPSSIERTPVGESIPRTVTPDNMDKAPCSNCTMCALFQHMSSSPGCVHDMMATWLLITPESDKLITRGHEQGGFLVEELGSHSLEFNNKTFGVLEEVKFDFTHRLSHGVSRFGDSVTADVYLRSWSHNQLESKKLFYVSSFFILFLILSAYVTEYLS